MLDPMSQVAPTVATLLIPVPRSRVDWEIGDEGEKVPQSEGHDLGVELLTGILRHWAKTSGARVCRELATRWVKENYRIGVDPDISVLLPQPPVAEEELYSNRTWLPGHSPPLVAVEIVSRTNPVKDYSIAPDKYAASGTKELWIFDPRMVGPKSHGGPFRLQVYRRDEEGRFARIYAGEGPVKSPALDAWLVVTAEGRRLRIANDQAATDFWLTGEEAAKAQAEAANAKAEASNAKAEAALAELAALKAELARRGG